MSIFTTAPTYIACCYMYYSFFLSRSEVVVVCPVVVPIVVLIMN